MNDDNLLVGGFYPKPPRDGAPEFVMGKININLPQFRDWLKGYVKDNPNEEWLSLDSLISKNGKGYCKVDTWKPDPDKQSSGMSGVTNSAGQVPPLDDDDALPF